MSQRSLVSTGAIAVALILFGKVVSFGKDVVISSYFGASNETDAFFIALNITSILFVAFYSTVTIVFLPLYNQQRENKTNKEASDFNNSIISFYLLISLIISIISFNFSNELVSLISSNISIDRDHLTANLLRIMVITFSFSVFVSFLNAIQLSNKQYILPHLIPIINNSIVLIALILFTSDYGIYVPVISGVFAWVFQVPMNLWLVKNHFRFSFNLMFKPKDLHVVGKLFFPAFLGVSIDQANILVDTILASGLSMGSISALNYSNRMISFSSGIFIMGIMSIMFPIFSKYFEQDLTSKFNDSIRTSLRILLITLTLTTIIIFVYHYELISLVFGRGNFDKLAIDKTSSVFFFYSIGLVFLGLRELFNKVFYAQKNTKSPLYISLFAVTSNIIMSITLVKIMGVNGLALSTSLSLVLYVTIQLIILRKTIGIDFLRGINSLFIKLAIASILSILSMLLLKNLLPFEGIIIQIFVGTTIATFIYTMTLYLLKTEELLFLITRIKNGHVNNK